MSLTTYWSGNSYELFGACPDNEPWSLANHIRKDKNKDKNAEPQFVLEHQGT
ncbi:MAG: hypothetical protein KGQ51_01240 [Planctomycetes bacterium]|nr:hypothetical protein [Planctomycetota bacterium]